MGFFLDCAFKTPNSYLMKSSRKIALLAIIPCFVWGSAFAFAKIGFEYMPPIRLSGFRFILAGLILLPILLMQKYDWQELKGQLGFVFLFAFIQTFCQYGLFYYGLHMAPSAISAIIIGAGPFFVAILAHFLVHGDRLTTRKIVSIAFGLSGVVFISLKNNVSIEEYPNFYLGILILILSNIIGSYTNIMVVNHKKKLSTVALTAIACFTGGIMLYILSLFLEPEGGKGLLGYPTELYVALLWLALIPAIGFSIWYYLLQLPNVKVSELNIWKFLVPVFGVVLSWIILKNESPDLYSIIGILIISSSIIILQYRK